MALKHKSTKLIPLIIAIFLGLAGGLILANHQANIPILNHFLKSETQPANKYMAFLLEVRETILENYWDTLNEAQFVNLHVLAIEKLIAQPLGSQIQTYDDLDKKLEELLAQYPEAEIKQEFAVNLADLVLANLEPFGRSRLYSEQLEQELTERVHNIDPDADHYASLEVSPEATQEEIALAYEKQKQALIDDESEEAQQKIAQVEQAHRTLADQSARQRYDEAGVNPTMEWRLLSPSIFYLHIKQFSPVTVQELAEVTQKVDDRGEELDTLVLDLRNNIGGAIDGLPYFLGPFIGNNQYAYQFIQQGKTKDFKTRTGWLPSLTRYKKVVILINEQTQSTGEMMASVLKKYNVGVLVGSTTMGWGTIERIFPIENQISESEKFSIFLVHHLTLREDGNPIESNGVDPVIDVSTPNWQTELTRYFNDLDLTSKVADLFTSAQ